MTGNASFKLHCSIISDIDILDNMGCNKICIIWYTVRRHNFYGAGKRLFFGVVCIRKGMGGKYLCGEAHERLVSERIE